MSLKSYASAFVTKAFITLGLVIAFVVLMTVITLVTMAEQTNRQALQRQNERMSQAIVAELRLARNDAALIASGRSARFAADEDMGRSHSFGRRLQDAWHVHGFNAIYAVDRAGVAIAGAEMGEPAGDLAYRAIRPWVAHLIRDVRLSRAKANSYALARLASPGFEQGMAHAALMFDNFGLSIGVVTAFNTTHDTGGDLDLLVGVRSLSPVALAEIGNRFGLDNLRFRLEDDGRSPLSHPVRDAAGAVIGFIVADADRPGSTLLPSLLMLAVASLLAVALAFGALFQRLRRLAVQMTKEEEHAKRLATHDHLSGLLNRMSFDTRLQEEVDRARRYGGAFALHLIDLDRFKEVNDTYGHRAGDLVIQEVARRISDIVRGADVVARLGGDEFGIIQVETDSTLEAGALAARLRDTLRRPISIGSRAIEVGCSIGIALGPSTDQAVMDLISDADSALYQAKNDGRNRHRFYEASLDEAAKMKQLVEEELREAIAGGQLEIHYQPQVSADGMRILGAEALVRWRHPTRGMIPPGEFIHVAEECGLVIPLNDWVLRRACLDAKRWGDLSISVNVSAAQFKLSNFVDNLMTTVREAGFDPARLELELTEGMIVEDEEKAEEAIAELRRFGVRMALDDFGTGYSSLIYLRRFSFDKIKIDRSFLESVEAGGESAILVHSVVHLGRALGLTVCAEGVETHEQRRFLHAVGCHELQGYVFSRPVPAAEFEKLLALAEPFRRAA